MLTVVGKIAEPASTELAFGRIPPLWEYDIVRS